MNWEPASIIGIARPGLYFITPKQTVPPTSARLEMRRWVVGWGATQPMTADSARATVSIVRNAHSWHKRAHHAHPRVRAGHSARATSLANEWPGNVERQVFQKRAGEGAPEEMTQPHLINLHVISLFALWRGRGGGAPASGPMSRPTTVKTNQEALVHLPERNAFL